MSDQSPVEERLKDIKRRTRKKYTAEEKLRIVLEGIKGESSIAELCRREGIHANQYYTWSKEFLDAGKQRLSGNTKREATSPEVENLRKENAELKTALAEVFLKNQILKKSLHGLDPGWDE